MQRVAFLANIVALLAVGACGVAPGTPSGPASATARPAATSTAVPSEASTMAPSLAPSPSAAVSALQLTAANGWTLALLDSDPGFPSHFAATPDGRYVVTADRTEGVPAVVYDRQSRARNEFPLNVGPGPGSFALSADGRLITFSCPDRDEGAICSHDLATGDTTVLHPLRGPKVEWSTQNVTDFDVSADGRTIVFACSEIVARSGRIAETVTRLCLQDRDTDRTTVLRPTFNGDLDVDEDRNAEDGKVTVAISADGRHMVFGARRSVWRYDIKLGRTGELVRSRAETVVTMADIGAGGSSILFAIHSDEPLGLPMPDYVDQTGGVFAHDESSGRTTYVGEPTFQYLLSPGGSMIVSAGLGDIGVARTASVGDPAAWTSVSLHGGQGLSFGTLGELGAVFMTDGPLELDGEFVACSDDPAHPPCLWTLTRGVA